ncbi:MAG: hypothetical protein WB624_06725 [Xanthobacteraceae bacterium]
MRLERAFAQPLLAGESMGSHLKRTSELHDIEAALKRAAYKATHGTREERSGRFLPAEKSRATSLNRKPKRVGESRNDGTAVRGR